MNTIHINATRRAGVCALATLITGFIATVGAQTPDAPPTPAPAVVAPAAPAPGAPANQQQNGRGNRVPGIQRGAAPGGGNFGGGGGIGFGGLNLDDTQRQLLQDARLVNTDELRKLNEKLIEAQKELVKVVVAEKYDEKVVREKAEAVAKIQTEITMLGAKAVATISPTLKPEQRDQLESSYIVGLALINGGGRGGIGGPGGNFGGGPGGGNFAAGDPAAGGFGGGRGGRGGGNGNFGNGGGNNADPGNNGGNNGGNNRRRGGNTGGSPAPGQ